MAKGTLILAADNERHRMLGDAALWASHHFPYGACCQACGNQIPLLTTIAEMSCRPECLSKQS